MTRKCFRPLFGVSLFLHHRLFHQAFQIMFSSPLRGISISTETLRTLRNLLKRFRPLYGVSLFLQNNAMTFVEDSKVFVPSTGYLYFYEQKLKEYGFSDFVFVPSTGYLYFYKRKMM